MRNLNRAHLIAGRRCIQWIFCGKHSTTDQNAYKYNIIEITVIANLVTSDAKSTKMKQDMRSESEQKKTVSGCELHYTREIKACIDRPNDFLGSKTKR